MRTPQHIGVASALSPRFRAVLAEAWRFARHFDSRFSILHAGAATDEKIALFQAAIDSLGLPTETMIACADGEPAPALLSLATAHRTDLLIAGALERDVERHFLSSVARTLLRESPGSLMLFTQPSEDPQPLRQIVLVTDFTQAAHEAVQFALHLAEREQAEVLHVLSVLTPFAAARTEADGRTEEDRLDDFVSFAADSPASIDARVIHSTTGMAVADFTKTVGADLLIVPASSGPDGRTQLPTCVDWVTQVIPCNLLVVKPARCMTDAFALLDLPRRPWLDTNEVRAAFQRRAMTAHPDHAGDSAAFTELTRAYETLREPARLLRHFLALERPGIAATEMPADLIAWFPRVAKALDQPSAAAGTLAELNALRDTTLTDIRENAANIDELACQLPRLVFLDKWIAQLSEALLALKL